MSKKERVDTRVSRIVSNHLEVRSQENLDMKDEGIDKIFICENFSKKVRKALDVEARADAKKQVQGIKADYPKAEVIYLCQFNKGTKRGEAQLSFASDVDTVAHYSCFYEQYPAQSTAEYENQLGKFQSSLQKRESLIVLEPESNHLTEKVLLTLNAGLKRFVIIGGKYGEIELWILLIKMIHQYGGEVTIALTNRYHITTKVSYIQYALDVNADYILHELMRGGEVKTVLYLDEDLVYRERSKLKNKQLLSDITQVGDDKSTQYALSRVLALRNANTSARRRPFQIEIHE